MKFYSDVADALAAADWSNTPIGNKAIILAAIDRLGVASRLGDELEKHAKSPQTPALGDKP